MLSCREVAESIASGNRGGLWRKLMVRMHATMCRKCHDYERQLEQIKQAAQEAYDGASVEEEIDMTALKSRIVKKVESPSDQSKPT